MASFAVRYIADHFLPHAIVILPLCGTVLIALLGRRETLRNLAAILTSGGTFCLCGLLFLEVLEAPLVLAWPHFLDIGLIFKVDITGALFALFASFIWFMATVFSWTYMGHEHQRTRYYIFLMLSLVGCLGVFLTRDLFSLFIFFEFMSLISYVLVIHAETEEAMDAGRSYLYLSVIGGLSLLTGIMLLYRTTGNAAMVPQLELLEEAGPFRLLILAFLIIGFGIKAGMVPLHVWLPKAHPVAPSPASALLSGIMIKTGAYGIIRVTTVIFTPSHAEHSPLWKTAEEIGLFLIGMAILTMASAAVMALFQTNIKRLLAYSSISQMGYILMGVGCAAYLGPDGPMGFAGFTYHILNHAFFKATLFMLAGAVYVRTHELELSRLGGLARKFPVAAAVCLISAAGIAGVPGFNGYISKTLLHHAIVEAYEHHHLFALHAAEILFTLTGALTVCYIFKLFTGVFTGKMPAHLKKVSGEPFLERVVFLVLGGAIIWLGMSPKLIIQKVIIPAAGSFAYDSYHVKYLGKLNFINWPDLQGVLVPITLGLALLYLMKRKDLFARIRLPGWLSIDGQVYNPVSAAALSLFTTAGKHLETTVDRLYIESPAVFARVSSTTSRLDEAYLAQWGRAINQEVRQIRDDIYVMWTNLIGGLFGNLARLFRGVFRTLFQVDYRPRGRVFQTINVSNLDFNLLIIVLTLIVILGLTFILRFIAN